MGNRRFTIPGLSQWENIRRSWTQQERRGNQGFISMGNYKFRSIKLEQDLCLSLWERRDNHGLISMGNHRFTIPGLTQWENITRSWTQQERRGDQGFIWMGNYKFRSIKLEVRVSGYMDILILNMYSARPLSLNGKEGTTRDSFQWKIISLGVLN